MYWAASCGGCEIAVLNIHEAILDVDANFEVVFWPVAMDAKIQRRRGNGGRRDLSNAFQWRHPQRENEHLAHLMRQKSQLLIAFGSCATEGCIPGLANLSTSEQIFETVYQGPVRKTTTVCVLNT